MVWTNNLICLFEPSSAKICFWHSVWNNGFQEKSFGRKLRRVIVHLSAKFQVQILRIGAEIRKNLIFGLTRQITYFLYIPPVILYFPPYFVYSSINPTTPEEYTKMAKLMTVTKLWVTHDWLIRLSWFFVVVKINS